MVNTHSLYGLSATELLSLRVSWLRIKGKRQTIENFSNYANYKLLSHVIPWKLFLQVIKKLKEERRPTLTAVIKHVMTSSKFEDQSQRHTSLRFNSTLFLDLV